MGECREACPTIESTVIGECREACRTLLSCKNGTYAPDSSIDEFSVITGLEWSTIIDGELASGSVSIVMSIVQTSGLEEIMGTILVSIRANSVDTAAGFWFICS